MGLIVISLALLSTTFSESEGGPLHSAERAVAAALGPLQEGAERALKPARDMLNWFDETFEARGENDELRSRVEELTEELAETQGAQSENEELRSLLGLQGKPPVVEYEPVTARVIGRSPTVWYSTVTIDHGSSSGIGQNDPVITGEGLVGRITDTTGGTAQVTMITDHRSAVSARVLPDGPEGIVEPEAGNPSDLLLDFIEQDKPVSEGQILVTAGWSDGAISSAYPYGLRIGRVTEASGGDDRAFQEVRVEPFADLKGMDFVQVLTGGPPRPGVPG